MGNAEDSLSTLKEQFNIRLTGIYLNPNNTGFMANLTLVFSLGLLISKYKYKLLNFIFIFLSIFISLRSFSKTSMIISMMILLVFGAFYIFYFKYKNAGNRKTIRLYLISYIFLFSVGSTFAIKEFNNLDEAQKVRIDQMITILTTGQFNRETTTLRSDIWKMAIVKIKEYPVLGSGFNTFNFFKKENQGVHNMYLKIMGEAGIFVFLLFIFSLVIIFIGISKFENTYLKFIIFATLVIMLVFNGSNHNAFENNISSAFLGLILGICAKKT